MGFNKEKESREPDYSNSGVAVWVNDNPKIAGEKMLSIKLVGHETVYAYKHKPKPKKIESSQGGL